MDFGESSTAREDSDRPGRDGKWKCSTCRHLKKRVSTLSSHRYDFSASIIGILCPVASATKRALFVPLHCCRRTINHPVGQKWMSLRTKEG